MKITLALLLSLGLTMTAAPLHAESGDKQGTSTQGSTSSEKGKEGGSSGSGSEPECN